MKTYTMKNYLLSFLIIAACLIGFSSCNTYHSIGSATKMSHLSANPFMKKVAKSVITNISNDVIKQGATAFKGKPKLLSTLNSLFNTPKSVTLFKNMLTNNYGISKTAVENNYSKWTTVKDVIGYIAKSGKRYDFNSYSNKLF